MGLGLLQGRLQRANEVDPISRVIRAVVSPGGSFGADGIRSAEGSLRGWREGPRLAEENESLRRLVAALSLYKTEAETLQQEIGALERQVGLPYGPGRTQIPARVIGFWPTLNRLTLNAGRSKGIAPDLPVVGPGGLVGTVDTVDQDQCQVILLSSPAARIGAKIVREGPLYGITRGLKPGALTMEIVGSGPAEAGDQVVTSGLSDLIPGGIPIGEVTEVDDQPAYGTRLATIFPTGAVGNGAHLVVLK